MQGIKSTKDDIMVTVAKMISLKKVSQLLLTKIVVYLSKMAVLQEPKPFYQSIMGITTTVYPASIQHAFFFQKRK